MRILVTGGTGFIGRHLAARLAPRSHEVVVPTRHYGKGRDLLVLPGLVLLEADVHDDDVLNQLVRGCDAVVNLVGTLHGSQGRPYGAEFARAHVLLPQRIARCCRRHGVRRLLHLSALGADPAGSSMYLRSKGDGEAAIRAELPDGCPTRWTLLRPSVVFGRDDNFTNLFARLARRLPVLPLAGAQARMQPVHVADVVQALEQALCNPHTYGKVYELGGPQVHTLGDIARLCAAWSGHPRPVWNLPMALGLVQAALLECLPGTPLMSRDNLASLKTPSVSSVPVAPELGVAPVAMEAVVPGYLRR